MFLLNFQAPLRSCFHRDRYDDASSGSLIVSFFFYFFWVVIVVVVVMSGLVDETGEYLLLLIKVW